QPVPLQPDQLAGIVGENPDGRQTEVQQDLRADTIIAQVGLEPQLLVGRDGVAPGVLELVRLQLVEEPDATALLVEVNDDPVPLPGDYQLRAVQLTPAVTARRPET